jgi:hypothetical protein
MHQVDNAAYQRKEKDQPVPALFRIMSVSMVDTKRLKKKNGGVEAVHRQWLGRAKYKKFAYNRERRLSIPSIRIHQHLPEQT